MPAKDNVFHVLVGRFNPLTVYHLDVIRTLPMYHSVVATTITQGNDKNPLSYPDKYRWMDRALIQAARYNTLFPCTDVLDAIKNTHRIFGCEEIVLHCGSDRAEDYLRLNSYTEPEGIRIVDVQSIARLDCDQSATYLRELAKQGRKKEFKQLCGYVGRDKDHAYKAIRDHYECV